MSPRRNSWWMAGTSLRNAAEGWIQGAHQRHRPRTDLSGRHTQYGPGVTGAVNHRHHQYADVERTDGEHLDKPWSVNPGHRLSG